METKRHLTNPFLEGMIIPVKGKQIRLSILGQDDDILLNQTTGEKRGTHLVTYKKVDGEQFVKLFTTNICMAFDLTSAGIKALSLLVWSVQGAAITRDQIDLDKFTLKSFLEEHEGNQKPILMSQPTLWRGLSELEKAQIIAKAERRGRYFINPNFIFNGDRIAFTTLIERNQSQK